MKEQKPAEENSLPLRETQQPPPSFRHCRIVRTSVLCNSVTFCKDRSFPVLSDGVFTVLIVWER